MMSSLEELLTAQLASCRGRFKAVDDEPKENPKEENEKR